MRPIWCAGARGVAEGSHVSARSDAHDHATRASDTGERLHHQCSGARAHENLTCTQDPNYRVTLASNRKENPEADPGSGRDEPSPSLRSSRLRFTMNKVPATQKAWLSFAEARRAWLHL